MPFRVKRYAPEAGRPKLTFNGPDFLIGEAPIIFKEIRKIDGGVG